MARKTLDQVATRQVEQDVLLIQQAAFIKEQKLALVRANARLDALAVELATAGDGAVTGLLSAAIAAKAGQVLTLPASSYDLDASVAATDTAIAMHHGAVVGVTAARTLGSRIDFSQGGQFRPAAGVALTLTGRLSLPPNHHAFDISLGGTMQIDQICIDRLTPYNFGADGNGTAEDSVEVRAWLAACQWEAGDANGGILESLPPGRFLVGLVMDEDERGDFVFARLNKTGSRMIGAGRRISSFKFNPAPAWVAEYAYPAGSLISNGGNLYKTTDGGTSAESPATGPSGAGSGIADGTVEWDFVAADDGSRKFILFRIEEQPATEPSLYQKMAGFQIAANGDTTHRKVAIDAHDIRRMELEDIAIETWTDSSNSTGAGSIGALIRGRDASVMEECFIDCDTPICLAQNDNETEPLDGDGLPTVYRDASGKDIDHLSLVRCVLNCDNAYNANILRTPGTVSRNIEFGGGDSTLVDGGVVFVDILDSGGVPFAGAEVEAKRTSNLLYIGRGRIEGNMGTDGWGIRVEQHENSPMQDVVVDGLLIGEGYDARREAAFGGGDAGAAWAAIKTRNVRFLTIKSGTRYFGANVVLDVDSGCVVTIEPGAILVPTDLKKVYPEHASQWTFIRDYLGHPTLQGLDHWYQLSEGSGTHASFSGSFPLGRTGSADPVLQQLRPGSLRYWLGFTNVGGQRVQVGVVDAALALASHSKLFDSVWEIDSTWTPGAITALMNMAGDAGGPSVRMNTDGTLFILANGISGTATTLNVLDGVRFRVSLAHNRTAGTLEALVTKANGEREAFTGTYFAAPSNLSPQGFGAISGISSVRGWMTTCGIALDANAEQDLEVLHDATGWIEAA